jgi:hypothetical protein
MQIPRKKIDQNDKNKAQLIINRLLGKKETTQKTEAEFLHQEFSKLDLSPLNLDSHFEIIIKQRMDEIKNITSRSCILCYFFMRKYA